MPRFSEGDAVLSGGIIARCRLRVTVVFGVKSFYFLSRALLGARARRGAGRDGSGARALPAPPPNPTPHFRRGADAASLELTVDAKSRKS